MPPQMGEVRSANGETRAWNGSRWESVEGGAPASAGVPMYHPGLNDTPMGAEGMELARTAGKAALGVAKTPLAMVNALIHPVDTVTNTAHAIAHPMDTLTALENDPEAAGGVLGSLLLGKYAPDIAEAAPNVAGAVGRGTSAVGRGIEAVGTSTPARYLSKMGMMEGALRMDPKGLVMAGAPKALELGGQGLQKAGSMLEGLVPPPPTFGPKPLGRPFPSATNVETLRPMVDADTPTFGGRVQPTRSVDDALAGLRATQDTPRWSGQRPFEVQQPGLEPGAFTPDEGRLVPPESDLIHAVYPSEERGLAGLRRPRPF